MKNRKKFLRYRANKRKISNYGAYIKSTCPKCDGEELFFYDRYDAICCLYCDEWIDKACGSPECPYCSKRPSTPSEALYFEQERSDIKKGLAQKKLSA